MPSKIIKARPQRGQTLPDGPDFDSLILMGHHIMSLAVAVFSIIWIAIFRTRPKLSDLYDDSDYDRADFVDDILMDQTK